VSYMTDNIDLHECSREGHYGIACSGDLILQVSRSGLTRSWICEDHAIALDEKLDSIERRYPEINHPEYCGCYGCSEGSY